MTASRTVAPIVAALTGGVLAALLVDLDTSTKIVVTVVAVVVGGAVAMLLADSRAPEPAAAAQPQRRPNDWWSGTAPTPPPARQPQPAPQPPRLVLGTGRGGQWWEQTGSPASAPTATRSAPPAPELTSYVESARVVQCPRCGAFRIDVTRAGAGFSFHCTVDGHRWSWRPDTAWPATVVVSRRRTRT